MAIVKKIAPGISAAPANNQLPRRFSSRLAKNPISQAGGEYKLARSAQLSISHKRTQPAAIARMGGPHAPHHGANSARLKAIRQPGGYLVSMEPNRDRIFTSVRPNSTWTCAGERTPPL